MLVYHHNGRWRICPMCDPAQKKHPPPHPQFAIGLGCNCTLFLRRSHTPHTICKRLENNVPGAVVRKSAFSGSSWLVVRIMLLDGFNMPILGRGWGVRESPCRWCDGSRERIGRRITSEVLDVLQYIACMVWSIPLWLRCIIAWRKKAKKKRKFCNP